MKKSTLLALCAFVLSIPGAADSQPKAQIRISVVPFRNLTGDPDKGWLGEGIADTLTTRLGSVNGLTLTERSQLAEAMKELELSQTGLAEEDNAIQTGKILSSQYLIIGSYQIAGDQVLINSRMIDVETSGTKKTAMVRGKMDDIFDLQEQLAEGVLAWLKVGITKSNIPPPVVTGNVHTFEYLSRARQELWAGNMNEAANWALKAIESDPESADAYSIAGQVCKERGEFTKALEYYQKAGDIYKNKNDDSNYALTLRLMGNIFERQNRYQDALGLYNQSMELAKKRGDRGNIAKAYLGMGNVSGMTGKYEESLDYFQRSLEIQRELGDDFEVATLLNNIGLVNLYQSRYDKAQQYLEESLKISRSIGKKSGQALALTNLGLLYKNQGKCDRAMEYLNECISICREIDNKYYLAFALNQQGDCYLAMKKPEKARAAWEESLTLLMTLGVTETANQVQAKLKNLK